MACSYTIKVEPYGIVEVLESLRCRRMTLRIHDNGTLRISTPPYTNVQEIVSFVEKNGEHIDSYRKKNDTHTPIIFTPQTHFSTFSHKLCLIPSATQERLRMQLTDDTINVSYPQSLNHDNQQLQDFVHKCIDRTLLYEAKQYIPQRITALAHKENLQFTKLDFRNMRSRWGSCSSSGRICLNIQLMRLPAHLIDMVILHELNHLRHMNHGPQFHADLNKMCNGHLKELEAELRNWRTTY